MSKRALKLLLGDCLMHLRTMEENTLDSLVCDPPAGISFMGKDWDHHKGGRTEWVSWMTEVMRECMRVMKPGAHGLVWAIPRTSHWMAWALEDAGFEVRDVVTHLFGSGFPKSLDVSKAIDKAAGAKREVIGHNPKWNSKPRAMAPGEAERQAMPAYTAPATDDAKKWQGFGTALKPASEHWILVRKPCSEKTVAANVLKWGTGALNIDASRIATEDNLNGGAYSPGDRERSESAWGGGVGGGVMKGVGKEFTQPQGRFPANLILSHSSFCDDTQCDIECAVAEMDRQSGTLKSGTSPSRRPCGMGYHGSGPQDGIEQRPTNEGGASRFFYCAKASKREKNAGLEGMPKKLIGTWGGEEADLTQGKGPTIPRANFHPTVKSTKLMTYLIRMITPPGGVVLDPFMGSGTTGVSAVSNGHRFIGIEMDKEYMSIAEKRINSAGLT